MSDPQSESELAWQLQDYLDHGIEPPERLIFFPYATEGELMSDDEVLGYIEDATRALMVLNDQGSGRFQPVQAAYFADLAYLAKLGRVSQEDYDRLISPENFRL